MPGFIYLPEDFRIIGRVFADREERCLDALVGQRLEHGLGVVEPRPVIKGQHHFARPKEVVLSEMLEAKPGPPVVSISTTREMPSALGLVQDGPRTAAAAAVSGGSAGAAALEALAWTAAVCVGMSAPACATTIESAIGTTALRKVVVGSVAAPMAVFAASAADLPRAAAGCPSARTPVPASPRAPPRPNRLLSHLLASLNLFYLSTFPRCGVGDCRAARHRTERVERQFVPWDGRNRCRSCARPGAHPSPRLYP